MFLTQPFVDSTPIVNAPSALRRRSAAQGYLFFRGLIEPELILHLRRNVLQVCQKFRWLADGALLMQGIARSGVCLGAYDDPRWIAFLPEVFALPEYVALRAHPSVINVLEGLYQERVTTCQGDICRVVSPCGLEFTTLPHQDSYYIRGTERLWTVWIPLGDCPVELGGLAVMPGSHKHGLMIHREGVGRQQGVAVPEDRRWATGDYACGDVLMFSGLTLHRACQNLTADRLRVSVDYRYQPRHRHGR